MNRRSHHVDHIHDRLIALLKRVIAGRAGDELLRLSLSDRVFPRMSEEAVKALRRGTDSESEEGRS